MSKCFAKIRRSTRSAAESKIFKLAEGFKFTEGPVGIAKVVSSCSVIRQQHDLQIILPRKVGSLRVS